MNRFSTVPLRRIAILATLLLAASTLHAQIPDLEHMDVVLRSVPDGPVARVNGTSIPRAEFARLYQLEVLRAVQLNGGQTVPDGVRVQLGLRTLGNLVQQELLHQEAAKLGVQIPPAKIEERWQKQIAQYRKADESLSEDGVLKALGVEDRQVVLNEVNRMLLVEAMYDIIIKKAGIEPTDQDLRALYDKEKASMVRPELLHLRQIFVRADANANSIQKATARQRAVDALKRIHAGQRFDAVVKDVSEAPDKKNGGEMGPFPVNQFPPFLVAAALKLKPEQISDVIESEFGFHIIQLIELSAGKDISFDEAKPFLKESIIADKGEESVNDYCDKLLAGGAEVFVYLELEKTLAVHPELNDLVLK